MEGVREEVISRCAKLWSNHPWGCMGVWWDNVECIVDVAKVGVGSGREWSCCSTLLLNEFERGNIFFVFAGGGVADCFFSLL